jgi:hypothetical protein
VSILTLLNLASGGFGRPQARHNSLMPHFFIFFFLQSLQRVKGLVVSVPADPRPLEADPIYELYSRVSQLFYSLSNMYHQWHRAHSDTCFFQLLIPE